MSDSNEDDFDFSGLNPNDKACVIDRMLLKMFGPVGFVLIVESPEGAITFGNRDDVDCENVIIRLADVIKEGRTSDRTSN